MRLVGRRDDRDFGSCPLDLRAGLGDDANAGDALHLFRGAGVDALELVRAREGTSAGLRTASPCGFMSDGYFARPLDLSGPSRRLIRLPMILRLLGSGQE